MTIAPIYVNNVTPRLHFDNTRKLYIDIKANKYDNIDMDILSMGMSSDFEDAIQCYTAQNHQISIIVTRNVKDYKTAGIIVQNPETFLCASGLVG